MNIPMVIDQYTLFHLNLFRLNKTKIIDDETEKHRPIISLKN